MLRRKITDELKEWKSNWSGRYALLIEGARRVGKTTVVRAFAESEYRTSIVLDFSQDDPRLKALFEESYTMDMLFTLLQELTDGKGVVPVEVKSSSRSSSHKSLDEFMKTYSRKVSKAYMIHQKNIRADGDIVYIPVYMTMFI